MRDGIDDGVALAVLYETGGCPPDADINHMQHYEGFPKHQVDLNLNVKLHNGFEVVIDLGTGPVHERQATHVSTIPWT